jgi:hypothetical protein
MHAFCLWLLASYFASFYDLLEASWILPACGKTRLQGIWFVEGAAYTARPYQQLCMIILGENGP